MRLAERRRVSIWPVLVEPLVGIVKRRHGYPNLLKYSNCLRVGQPPPHRTACGIDNVVTLAGLLIGQRHGVGIRAHLTSSDDEAFGESDLKHISLKDSGLLTVVDARLGMAGGGDPVAV